MIRSSVIKKSLFINLLKNKNKIFVIFSIILFLKALLILHRVSFDFNILINFYKKDIAIRESVKNQSSIEIKNFLVKNNLKSFYIDNTLKNDVEFYHRLIELSYPFKFSNKSNVVISRNTTKENCILLFKHKFRRVYDCKN